MAPRQITDRWGEKNLQDREHSINMWTGFEFGTPVSAKVLVIQNSCDLPVTVLIFHHHWLNGTDSFILWTQNPNIKYTTSICEVKHWWNLNSLVLPSRSILKCWALVQLWNCNFQTQHLFRIIIALDILCSWLIYKLRSMQPSDDRMIVSLQIFMGLVSKIQFKKIRNCMSSGSFLYASKTRGEIESTNKATTWYFNFRYTCCKE